MSPHVVVLGSGYAGSAAVQRLEEERADTPMDLTWISNRDYHFVLHEAHRVIRTPNLRRVLAIPVDEIKSAGTAFVDREVTDVESDDREILCADGSTFEFDFVLDCIGSRTAFYGIEGLEEHSVTLKSLDDALEIHDRVAGAAREASRDDPARVVVGGAGLSGIQTAGELAAWRAAERPPIEIRLVEALDWIYPGHSREFQGALRDRLEARDVEIATGATISRVDGSTIEFRERDPLEYDVLVWTGGITGIPEIDDPHVRVTDERVEVDATLRSDDDRVFVAGDAALVDQGDADPPPATAQSAWDAAEVAAENVARAIRGEPLRRWRYRNRGTLVSVGDDAVAHDVEYVPVSTFGGPPARTLKKAVGARWIGRVSSWRRATRAWPYL